MQPEEGKQEQLSNEFDKKNNENTLQAQVEKVRKTKSAPKTCPLKHSNFFLTINSQKNVFNMTEGEKNEVISKFTGIVDKFFNEDIGKYIVMEGSKIGEKFGMPRNAPRDELERRVVGPPKLEYVIEIGPDSHKLHSHGILCMTKRGVDTKLDYHAINKYFSEKLGYEIHFKCELFRDAKRDLQAYIRKAPAV